jgi:hypothetical protein
MKQRGEKKGRKIRSYPILIITSFVLLSGCYARFAQQSLLQRAKEGGLNTEAWVAANQRLHEMCPNSPAEIRLHQYGDKMALSEYFAAKANFLEYATKSGLTLPQLKDKYPNPGHRAIIDDMSYGCDARLFKITNLTTADDWDWDWLPAYQTIVRIHDEELRKRVSPKMYEEYMLGLSKFLAEKADNNIITPEQLKSALNDGWKWMVEQAKMEIKLLQDNVVAA